MKGWKVFCLRDVTANGCDGCNYVTAVGLFWQWPSMLVCLTDVTAVGCDGVQLCDLG